MSFTPDGVVEKLAQYFFDQMSETQRDYYGDHVQLNGSWWNEIDDWSDAFEVPGLGTVKCVDLDGGGEGGSSHVELVFSVTTEDGETTLYKKYGSYYSHDGYYWDGAVTRSRATEKTITVYEDVEA